jgi:hypothetical protein
LIDRAGDTLHKGLKVGVEDVVSDSQYDVQSEVYFIDALAALVVVAV